MVQANLFTKEFYDFVRAIGESKTKQEEDYLVVREITKLKNHFAFPRNSTKSIAEYVVRMIYCELLGTEAPFGYVPAIKLTGSNNIREKRVGYLGLSLCLDRGNEKTILVISSLQKDLVNTNYLIVCAALTCATKILSPEFIAPLLPSVELVLEHHQAVVRKKALLLIHSMHNQDENSIPNVEKHISKGLHDQDPSVMAAALAFLLDICKKTPEDNSNYKRFGKALMFILDQVLKGRLPQTYNYHHLPAPWVIITILKLYALLGKDDSSLSETFYPSLHEVLARCDTGINIGNAIVFECVRCITEIYPSNDLLQKASIAISRFVESKNNNLKYLGIKSLINIVKISPTYAAKYQGEVINCLEDPDESLKRITLSLLFHMTNSQNSKVICNKLLYFAKRAIDMDLRQQLIQQVTQLAEDFPPNNQWYFDVLNECFFIDAQFVSDQAIQTLLNVIAEGSGESEEEDEEFRRYAVEKYVDIMAEHSSLSDRHIQIISWVLGEYGYLSKKHSKSELIDILQDVCERSLEFENSRSWIFSALMKLVVQQGAIPPSLIDLIQRYKFSHIVEVQQRCTEFLKIANTLQQNLSVYQQVLPYDGSCEEIAVDSALSFLNNFVQYAQQNGLQGYLHEEDRDMSIVEFEKPTLILQHRSQPEPTQNAYAGDRYNPHSASQPTHQNMEQHPQKEVEKEVPQKTHGLNPSLLNDAKRVWFDSDEEDEEVETTQNFNQSQQMNPTQNAYSSPYMHSAMSSPAASSSSQGNSGNQGYGVSSSSNRWDSPYNNTPPPPRPQERDEPYRAPKRETTELVGAMFAGTGDNENRGGVKRKKNRKTRKNNNLLNMMDTEQQPEPTPNNMLDFDDFMNTSNLSSQNAPPTSTHSAPTTVQHSVDDMFDFGTADEAVKKSSSSDLDSMFSSVASEPVTAPHDDIFFSNISQTKNYAEQQATSNSLASTPCSIYKNLMNQYGSNQKPPTVACVDAYLKVSTERFYTPDALVLTVTFETERGYELTNVTFSIQSPTKWINQFRSEYPHYSSTNPTVVNLKLLQPGIPARVHIYYQLSGLGFGQSLIGTVNYSDNSKQSRHNTLNVKFSVFDLIRPKKSTIGEFGSKWKANSREKKNTLTFKTPQTPQSLADYLTKTCHVSLVQIRDSEIVCSAYLISLDLPCLVHAKLVKPKSATVTVRSKDTAFSNSVATAIASMV